MLVVYAILILLLLVMNFRFMRQFDQQFKK